jgi:hypothetical protein
LIRLTVESAICVIVRAWENGKREVLVWLLDHRCRRELDQVEIARWRTRKFCAGHPEQLLNMSKWCTGRPGRLLNMSKWCTGRPGRLLNMSKWCTGRPGQLLNMSKWCTGRPGRLLNMSK